MTLAIQGAIELGLIYAVMALGVYITYRILDFPDLTVDGSFTLGGAIAAIMITHGYNSWIATLAAFAARTCPPEHAPVYFTRRGK